MVPLCPADALFMSSVLAQQQCSRWEVGCSIFFLFGQQLECPKTVWVPSLIFIHFFSRRRGRGIGAWSNCLNVIVVLTLFNFVSCLRVPCPVATYYSSLWGPPATNLIYSLPPYQKVGFICLFYMYEYVVCFDCSFLNAWTYCVILLSILYDWSSVNM